MLRDHRLDARVAREDREGARAGQQRPPGLPVVGDPHGRALRQERQALRPAGQRPIETPIALLKRGEDALVEHEPRAGRPREDTAHAIAGRASAAGEHDRQRVVVPERPFQRRLVVLDEDTAGERDPLGGERVGDRRAVRSGDRHRADRHEVRGRGHGQPRVARPMAITRRAYSPAIRSSTMTPMPPLAR